MLSSSLPEPTLTSEQVLDCLGTIARCIHQTQSLDCILNTAVREVHKLLQTDRVLIYRCQADGSGVVVAESVGLNWTPILNQIIHDPCIETTWAEPDKQGRVRAIADIDTSDIQPCYLEFLAQFQVRANLVVPILLNCSEPQPSIQNQLWGLLIAHHCSSPRQWQPLEVNLLQQLAVQIAITIQQAELYQQAQAELVQRQEAQEELRRQREFLRNVIDTNPNLIFVKDWDGRFTLVNQALANIYGTTVEELTGKTDAEFNSTPAEVESYLQDDRQVMSSLQPKFIPEETLTSATGEVHYLQTVKKPLLSPDGQTRYVLATATDITKRKRAEQERDREAAERHRLLQQLEQQNQILETQVQERTARLRQINEQLLDEITTRQRLAAQLEEQARTLDTVLSASPDDVYMFDRAGRYLYANRGALESMSVFLQKPLQLSEIVGKTGYELGFPSDLLEPHNARLEGIFVTGEPLKGEISYPSDHDIRYRDYILTPLYAPDGSVEKVVVTSRDISDRKRSEAALRDSNQRIISILESITDAFFALNREWHFTYLNPRAEQILERTNQEVLGKNIWDEFPEAVDLAFYRKYHRALSEQVSIAFEEFYPPLNSWFEVYAYPTQEGLTVYFRDITERKRTQEALRESQEQLEAILDNSPAIIYLIDAQHRYLLINRQYENLVAITKEQILGKSIYEVWPPEIADAFVANNQKVLKVGTPVEVEELAPHKDGIHTYFSIKFPLHDANGVPYAVCGISTDITERKQANDSLKASLQEKETLLKEIHHRVKNNLQVISSLLRLQSRQIRDPQDLELFKDSQNRVQAMALIHELLYQSPNLAQIDFQDYIQTLAGNLCRSYNAHQRTITFTIHIEQVSLAIDTAIPCGLIVSELISNSLKHAFPEERGGEVYVSLQHSSKGQWMLVIGDNGIGMEPGFDFRHTSSLGLQLVCRLTKQLGGSIELDREQGTVFKITFATPK